MSTELEDGEFLDSFMRIYKLVLCVVCSEYSARVEKINSLKIEAWEQLKIRKAQYGKAKDQKSYGQRGASAAFHAAEKELSEIRTTIERLTQKENELQSEFATYLKRKETK